MRIVTAYVVIATMVVCFTQHARAQTTNTTCWRESNGGMSCTTTAPTPGHQTTPGEYGYLHDAGKADAEAAGRQLGQLINRAFRQPKAVSMILTIKCGQYVAGTLIYDNNTTKAVSLDPTPASDANLAAVQTAFPNVKVAAIDGGC